MVILNESNSLFKQTNMATDMARWIEPLNLTGYGVSLEPLGEQHHDALVEATRDGDLWELWFTGVPAPDATAAYLDKALLARDENGEMPFIVRFEPTGEIIGSTRFCNVDETHNRLEIGYTWYAQRVQRTHVNSACKLLLLEHAFEDLGAIAVEFRTHWHNRASRAAIARLGAKQDGVLRNHQRNPNGGYRDTVVFSIINAEWPTVKQSLLFQLTRGRE